MFVSLFSSIMIGFSKEEFHNTSLWLYCSGSAHSALLRTHNNANIVFTVGFHIIMCVPAGESQKKYFQFTEFVKLKSSWFCKLVVSSCHYSENRCWTFGHCTLANIWKQLPNQQYAFWLVLRVSQSRLNGMWHLYKVLYAYNAVSLWWRRVGHWSRICKKATTKKTINWAREAQTASLFKYIITKRMLFPPHNHH